MVILDDFKLPDKKILLKILAGIALVFIIVSGLVINDFYIKNVVTQPTIDEEQVKREARDRALYESTIDDLINSFGLTNLYTLLNDLYEDRYALRGNGWDLHSALCSGDACTSRYVRRRNSIFNYVVQKKNDVIYEPMFNQNELTFEGVIYPIGERDNLVYRDTLDNIMSCTDFITEVYQLDQLISGKFGSSFFQTDLTLHTPEKLINFTTNYDWAHHIDIKKGTIVVKIEALGKIKIIKDQFPYRFIRYDSLDITDNKLNVNLSYYCL